MRHPRPSQDVCVLRHLATGRFYRHLRDLPSGDLKVISCSWEMGDLKEIGDPCVFHPQDLELVFPLSEYSPEMRVVVRTPNLYSASEHGVVTSPINGGPALRLRMDDPRESRNYHFWHLCPERLLLEAAVRLPRPMQLSLLG